ncbi:MAG: signal recognition particle-docking protein FtsY [Prevotellaceae bacterium]|jgi:fused signal recognition particle receptor|nr:signal recognition particle-docking protein FtsY [Prevotellaceae bacterium]
MAFFSLFSSKKAAEQEAEQTSTLERGLEKTREGILKRISRAVVGKSKVDDEVLDSLEEALISSDVGVETTLRVVELVQQRVARDKVLSAAELNHILREEIVSLLEESPTSIAALPDTQGNPYVVMVVGVNGAGKTTTVGKLAAQLASEGKKVYIGAADTFRAAAIDQLEVWAARAGATIIKQKMGADPASVAFDTLNSAKANGAHAVFVDTAGRLHNKVNLMNELAKIRSVMQKVIPDAPHEVLLVLDGSTGQNAFQQAREFSKATEVTALAITKLDGTAKGGVVIGISHQLKIPVKYIGVGEQVGDLQLFDRKKFVETLFAGA